MNGPDKHPSPTPVPRPAPALTQLNSLALFNGQREVLIVHNGEEYRLRITRQDKLILTK